MNNEIFNEDEQLYLKASEYCRNLKPEHRGDLFYTLLAWKFKHLEIQESIARKTDTYDVLFINNDGVSHKESFTVFSGGNPYRLARQRYFEIIDKGAQVAEFRHRPNPYMFGPERMGSLILSYEKE